MSDRSTGSTVVRWIMGGALIGSCLVLGWVGIALLVMCAVVAMWMRRD